MAAATKADLRASQELNAAVRIATAKMESELALAGQFAAETAKREFEREVKEKAADAFNEVLTASAASKAEKEALVLFEEVRNISTACHN